MSAGLRLARRFVEALLAGLLAGIVLLLLAPVAIGWRPYTVLTGSMRPGIQPGDVVMDRPIPVSAMHVGDVVTFSDPSRHGDLVTHRVRSIAHGKGSTTVETRGDANNTSEHWNVQTKDRVGKVVYVVPKVGHVATLVRNPLGILVLVVIPVLGLGFLALRSIWRDDEDEDDDGDGPPSAQLELPLDDPGTEPQPDPARAAEPPAEPAASGADASARDDR